MVDPAESTQTLHNHDDPCGDAMLDRPVSQCQKDITVGLGSRARLRAVINVIAEERVSSELLDALLSSLASATIASYSRQVTLWMEWNDKNDGDWTNLSLDVFAKYVASWQTKHRTASFFAQLLSAMKFVFTVTPQVRKILDGKAAERIIKAASRHAKPTRTKSTMHVDTANLSRLLHFTQTLDFKREADLRLRAILLLRLALFARNSDMARISLTETAVTPSGLRVVFYPLKQSTKNVMSTRLIPRNEGNQMLCPVFSFECYKAKLDQDPRTNGGLGSSVRLLPDSGNQMDRPLGGVMPEGPLPPVKVLFRSLRTERLVELSADRIGSLTREALRSCQINDWQPHHLRMVAASVCVEDGMSLVNVLMTGGWNSESTLRTHYLAQVKGSDVMSRLNASAGVEEANSDTSVSSDADSCC